MVFDYPEFAFSYAAHAFLKRQSLYHKISVNRHRLLQISLLIVSNSFLNA